MSELMNLYDKTEMCHLVSNLRHKYYKQRYNITKVINNIYIDSYGDYMDELEKVIVMEDDYITLRCNCISLVLYSPFIQAEESYNDVIPNISDNVRNENIKSKKYEKYLISLEKYLLSIIRSVKNVKNSLSNWIVRLYLDDSVYNLIKVNNLKSKEYIKVNQLLDSLFRYDNVEVYTIRCPMDSRLSSRERTRLYRIYPMLDNLYYDTKTGNNYGVNICAMREADGIVSLLDCRNLFCFEQQEKLFYIIPYSDMAVHITGFSPEKVNTSLFSAYSTWLYKEKMENKDYYSHRNNLFDLLAGTIAFKGKIKYEYFTKTIDKILEQRKKRGILLGDREDFNLDEIILLYLFQDLVSCEIKEVSYVDNHIEIIEYNQIEYQRILSQIFHVHNIIEIEYDISKPYESIMELITLKILKIDDYMKYVNISYEYEDLINGVDVNLTIIDTLFQKKNFDLRNWNMNLYNIKIINTNDKVLDLVNYPYFENYELKDKIYMKGAIYM